MREITHKGLARLVGFYGSHKIDPVNLSILELSSVEPDKIRREQLDKGMFEAITGSLGWFSEHTMKAKELSIENVINACEAYNSGNQSWSKWLGWCFHYITDWATPYHSIKLMIKYILDSENKNLNEDLFLTIIEKFANLAKFKIEHDQFESICEKRWQEIEPFVKENIIKFKNNKKFSVNLDRFDKMMDELSLRAENRSVQWANESTNQEFAKYMTQIAILMDLACRLVFERG